MPIYIDTIKEYPKHPSISSLWCHMMIGRDDDLEELHQFADSIGLKREWFQDKHRGKLPHYDLTVSKRNKAVNGGAVEVSALDMLRLCVREMTR